MKRGTTQPLFKSRRRPARTANRSLYIDEKERAMFRARASVFAATVRESERVCAVSPMLYTHDGNKNVSELVSLVDGGIEAHCEYGPFGAKTVSAYNAASIADDFHAYNSFRFSSEYVDDVLGLVYYNYRYNNQVIGRWTSRDIVRFRDCNLYLICENSVVNCYDRLGLVPEIIEHEPGEPPSEGWENERNAAETHFTQSQFGVGFQSCSGGKVEIKLSFGEVRIDIYFRSVVDVVQHRNDEYDHVACYINFRNSVYIMKGVINHLPCICPDEANEIAQKAKEQYEQAVQECDECNDDLDRPGGYHGH